MPVASDFAREMRLKTDNANGTELIRDIFLRIRQLLPVDVLEG
jgi:propanediol utilization protein